MKSEVVAEVHVSTVEDQEEPKTEAEETVELAAEVDETSARPSGSRVGRDAEDRGRCGRPERDHSQAAELSGRQNRRPAPGAP